MINKKNYICGCCRDNFSKQCKCCGGEIKNAHHLVIASNSDNKKEEIKQVVTQKKAISKKEIPVKRKVKRKKL